MKFYLMPTIIIIKEINSSYIWVQRCPVLTVCLHILCNQNVKHMYSLYQMSVCIWSTLCPVKKGEGEEYLNVSCNFLR